MISLEPEVLLDWHQSHQAHQSANALFLHEMALVTHMLGHLPHSEEWCLQEVPVSLQHKHKVHRKCCADPTLSS
ncbi:hypothetical protein [Roseovarius sp. ZX-A-9]|uniref:hypothetical protein n=1 Tax=Roseovarius sp. ZX-A-9 TaxID=3014783 RepID=UPI00232AB655|nr:hypothetical protein [Roseovarius sp. ZX-A-9]